MGRSLLTGTGMVSPRVAVCWFLLCLTLWRTGDCYFLKRGGHSDHRLSVGRDEHMKRRYWNDADEICIKKFCVRYAQQRSLTEKYVSCLKYYCPGAVLAVPRDLDSLSLFPVAFMLGEERRFCGTAQPLRIDDDDVINDDAAPGGEDANDGRDCIGSECNGVSSPSRIHISSHDLEGGARLTTLRKSMFSVCRQQLCGDLEDHEHVQCVRQRCCSPSSSSYPSTPNHQHNQQRQPGPDHQWNSELEAPLMRKRRINDDVSQCIQSYCSGKQLNERIVCIVKNCNRM